MKLTSMRLKNFRRLEDVQIRFESDTTVFVGPNNSGKTSATMALRLFLGSRMEFKIHDFSVSKIGDLDAFGNFADEDEELEIPSIELDLWFSIDPDIEFGRVFSLIPNVTSSFDEVGIRLRYCVKDGEKLKSEYLSVFPRDARGASRKSLSHYLSLENNLNRHFNLTHSALEKDDGNLKEVGLEVEEGRRVLQSILRVDFVDAQRNIDDQEASRSNRLSAAFASYYKRNLEQVEASEEASKVIDANNDSLTEHYGRHFKGLMDVIRQLGVPSINDRQLKIISSLSAEQALRGSTDLLYIDPNLDHELPEAYNGLGFKNLIYMAIQISHFHIQWMRTSVNRPLCQLIFVEEPEVHLHAQVQQTFIRNIWSIIHNAAEAAKEPAIVPQLAVTTHSSHILDAVEFGKVRYFRRCPLEGEVVNKVNTHNASKVYSLREFQPEKDRLDEDENTTLEFLKRYLKLTHCDLFFADAAVLVEGAVEKLLLPGMIEKSAPSLVYNYLTILEVGGAYAHRFAGLLEFLGIPYLVITDIDSVDSGDGRRVCRADLPDARTSNASLKFFLEKESVLALVELESEKQILFDESCFITYQRPTVVNVFGDSPGTMHGRTLEESFMYENISALRDNEIGLSTAFPSKDGFDEQYEAIYEHVRSSSFKKVEFALDIVSCTSDWNTPKYIADGLAWLDTKLGSNSSVSDQAAS